MRCDNCGTTDEIAYTLRTHPATGSETNSSEASSESIDLRFCSADCLREWTAVPTVGNQPSSNRRLRSTQ